MPKLHIFLPVLIASALTVSVMALVSQSGAKDEVAVRPHASSASVSQTFAGIPQEGLSLGRKDAPLTMVEFADLQCPFCRDYAVGVLPQIVDRYVRSGQLRLELRVLRFLGPDSVTAAAGAAAAAQRNRLWQYADLFYQRQGAENSGYVTHEFLHGIAADAGLDPMRFARRMSAAHAERFANRAEDEAELRGVEGTPSFFIGRSGGALQPMPVSALEFGQFEAAIEAAR